MTTVMEYARLQKLTEVEFDSLFLWGARQVGKSTLLEKLFPQAIKYDLLKSNEYARLYRHPELLREELLCYDENTLVIVDEIQKIPQLLDEVHWLMVNRGIRFILCGSSARKLKRAGTNLLGGRALATTLFPLVSAEIPDFDLIRGINNGMIPRHYMIDNPKRRLEAYVGVYLKEEIQAEAQVRALNTFSRFLDVAATCNGEIINWTNIAQDCGVSHTTVREYFTILEQTLIGYIIPPFTLSTKRRARTMPKFYFFDVGVVNYLLHRECLAPGSVDFGHAFEHFMIQEIMAYLTYSGSDERLSYWHTVTGYEVDAVIGAAHYAIEFKSSTEVQSKHTKGLKAFMEEFPNVTPIIVSLDSRKRVLNGINVSPAMDFLKDMWNGSLF